jgi:spore maturation protein CgeB
MPKTSSRRDIKKIFRPRKTGCASQRSEPDDLAVLDSESGKEIFMLGSGGKAREYSFLPPEIAGEVPDSSSGSFPGSKPFRAGEELPVLLGAGLGHALQAVLSYLERQLGDAFTLAVVDKEKDLLEASGMRRKYTTRKNLFWIDASTPEGVMKELGKWQMLHQGLPFRCLTNPFYIRLRRDYYGEIRRRLEESARINFWEKARYPKFKKDKPRILLITSGYFLIGEIAAACARLGLDHLLLQLPDEEMGAGEFIERLLQAVLSFKPDFALTLNHLGVDREGVLPDLLARIKLPLASWFVDNPHLILYCYNNLVSPWSAIFTWDADNLDPLRAMGFEEPHYLPLGTDHTRFAPKDPSSLRNFASLGWQSGVSFVGNSMLHKVEERMKSACLPPNLQAAYREVAAAFSESQERSVQLFLQSRYPDLLPFFLGLDSIERRLAYEVMITWEATLQYRLSCVRAILPFNPLIVGDDGWLSLLGQEKGWRYHPELRYYVDLPNFYPLSQINFNCTSKQMKGAVNQRVFDVPAANSFLITDRREQLEDLFEPGLEVICYDSPEEAGELVTRYLDHPEEKRGIIRAARRRVLAEHCYDHRLQTLIAVMRKRYA